MTSSFDTTTGNVFTIPRELEAQLDRLDECLRNTEQGCTSWMSKSHGAHPLSSAQVYQHASELTLTLAKLVSHCAGKPLERLDAYKAKLDKKQQRIDRARARYERQRLARPTVTLGIDDANRVIASVKHNKRATAIPPLKATRTTTTKQTTRTKKHDTRELAFLRTLNDPNLA
jgi:hypothetical protein